MLYYCTESRYFKHRHLDAISGCFWRASGATTGPGALGLQRGGRRSTTAPNAYLGTSALGRNLGLLLFCKRGSHGRRGLGLAIGRQMVNDRSETCL